MNTRAIVYDMLLSLEKGGPGLKADRLLKDVLDKYSYLERRDRAYIKHLFEGCLSERIFLEYVISLYSKLSVEKLKPGVRLLLCMGIYELYFSDAVPDRAAVNEAVALAGKKGLASFKGYINAVLRSASAKKDDPVLPDPLKNGLKYLSLKYSMPAWIAGMFLKRYGLTDTESIFSSYREGRGISIRYTGDPLKEEEWFEALSRQAESVSRSPFYEHAYEVKGAAGAASLPGFSGGMFAVQDISSVLSVLSMNIKEGDRVIDLCAAPGGKSCFAAALAGREGRVKAFDLSEKKLEFINENAARLKLSNVETKAADASVFNKELEGWADKVICDLPCSGLGVIGRKPDIKYRLVPNDIMSLSELQLKILKNAVSYVKKGGILMYSTCTVSFKENEENVRRLLESEEGSSLKPLSVRGRIPDIFLKDGDEGNMVQLNSGLPQKSAGHDGFFISLFEKI
ncbi:MAG: 16S rRNA (cytosine(967)-C(5))-methyltransferase RsmB [Lachnospiraceae bacterium]|nr:16S rRNA (cytosine(967)-C(5))-methyltransferase RsmB [Lachnospiraceae bacterium]